MDHLCACVQKLRSQFLVDGKAALITTPAAMQAQDHVRIENVAAKQLMRKLRQTEVGHIQRPCKKRRVTSEEAGALSPSDMDILLTPTAWVNDHIVSAVQRLLKTENPYMSGLQDPTYGLTYAFDIQSDEFVQVLHNGRDHWLTISTVGAEKDEVFVYDSMYTSVSPSVKNQIAAIVATTSENIRLSFVDVQKQSGGYDCGVFALAFATSLCQGTDPSEVQFDQKRIRKHLLNCVRAGKMEQFPVLKTRRTKNKIKSVDTVNVYCRCRMPEVQGLDMVECCECSEWFHIDCVYVPQQVLDDSRVEWFCPSCA